MKEFGNYALLFLAVVQTGFSLQYLLRSPWWLTPLGRIYATLNVILTLVLWQVSASVITKSDYPGREYWRLAIYGGGGLAVLVLWQVLRIYQRRGREERATWGDIRSQSRIWLDTLRGWVKR